VKINGRHQPQPGFTLIELLVVIAVISLLVSILLPSLKQAKDQAKRTICTTSLRSIGFAYELYAEDSNNYYPPTRTGDQDPDKVPAGISYPNAIDPWAWYGVPGLWEYVNGGETFPLKNGTGSRWEDHGLVCSEIEVKWDTWAWYKTGYGQHTFLPAINGDSNKLSRAGEHWSPANRLDIIDPSSKLHAADGNQNDTSLGIPWHVSQSQWNNTIDAVRHMGNYANMLFCDGHASSVSLNEIKEKPAYWFRSAEDK
jgi:prepilin-type N-terminal cleavage/methylation domain-containing protein/prepilin-type processing-associated H-X9-DG protein